MKAPPPAPQRNVLMSALIFGAIALAGVLVVLYAWRLPPFHSAIESTENALVRAPVTILSPQLSGYVVEVPVQDFQAVHQGELIMRIDDRIYQQRVGQAEAQVASAATALALAISGGSGSNAVSRSQQERAAPGKPALPGSASRAALEAALASAQAALKLAQIDLANTRVLAPRDGQLGQVAARPGGFVNAGAQITALVPAQRWVIANLKETQIARVAVGQSVVFSVDALDNARLRGRVERISPATGSELSVLAPDNATGNYVKIAQRIPVRISIDANQPLAARLRPGMSVVANIDTAAPRAADASAQPGR